MTLPAYEVFTEESATPVIRSVPLAHLSVELGHLYMDDFEAGPAHLLDQFRLVAPWAAAARGITAAELPERSTPRISTCFLIDDYFSRFSTPDKVVAMLASTAAEAGLEIDYVARESGCAVAEGVELARIVEHHLVSEPPEGATGSRPPVSESGWLTNGERSPTTGPGSAMSARPEWRPPRQSAVKNHSIFLDIELWREEAGDRLWSCPFLAAVWQLQRLGLVRHLGEPVAPPRMLSLDELPSDWDALPPVVQLNPDAAPFRAYRTFSVLGARFLPIEVAVRTILGQVAIAAPIEDQLRARARGERITLPGEFVDRIRYAFM
ncbi:SCO2522 family protein [Actinoplanes sp. NPDC051494]|uniref:SCO2522 family protein n=1 Tax=Actinoplanes sp. NPDC051494 TaxID=3363907 RepID=UPI0037B4D633